MVTVSQIKRFYPLAITIFLFVLIYLISGQIPKESISLFLNNLGVFGPVLFIVLTLLTFIIAPLSNTPLVLAGFYSFGINVIYLTAGAMFISSITNFWIAKYWGRWVMINQQQG